LILQGYFLVGTPGTPEHLKNDHSLQQRPFRLHRPASQPHVHRLPYRRLYHFSVFQVFQVFQMEFFRFVSET
jgi:hypothetical protein